MKFSLALSVAVLSGAANAHYTMDKLIINGRETNSWQYIRMNTRAEKYMPTKFINSFGTTPLDIDFRCNQGAQSNAGRTETAEIAPGTKLALKLAYGATMRHPGPMQVYMSKAPGAAKDYDGSGNWFKIYQATTCGSMADGLQDEDWCSWDKDRIEFTVPVGTPPGEYLVRAEHIGLHGAHGGEAEFYYSCAQVKVTGSGTGTPGPLVKIPGVYQQNDAAVNFSIWARKPYDPLVPGPAVWAGGNSGGAPAPAPVPTTTRATTTTTVRPTTTAAAPTTTVRPTTAPAPTTTLRPVTSARPVTTATPVATAAPVTTAAPSTPTTPRGGCRRIRKYRRCGGIGYTGRGRCASGSKCTFINPHFSQCL